MKKSNPEESTVLIVDNTDKQGGNVHAKMTNRNLSVTTTIVAVSKEEMDQHTLSDELVSSVIELIEECRPIIVLVDVCLEETLVDSREEAKGSWTGPALMRAILDKYSEQIVGSYSAYSKGMPTDIEKQKCFYNLDNTKHWNVDDLNGDEVIQYIHECMRAKTTRKRGQR
ncbi:MAG: hypothetical protein QGG42_18700 [Phycisphaerae bacterium]|jgi:hypothetical protein|nr:hypothetical protein [Phycisphaerae bacterium]